MSEIASWYYVGTFGQLGPLTKEQLEDLIEAGVIERSTYVWKPGMNDWLPAANTVELAAVFSKYDHFQSPPPTPTGMPPVVSASTAPPPPSTLSIATDLAFPGQGANIPPRVDTGTNPNFVSPSFHRPLTLQKSDRNRTVAGVLSILIPGGGRFYLGYSALGVIQLMLTIVTCGSLHIWSIIDGILILSGQVRIDGYGRALDD
jgi:TM2 domain-containing membrane protein YozV